MVTMQQLIATGEVRTVAWSPNGAQIAFLWFREGVLRLWAVPAAGGFPVLLTPHAVAVASPADAPQWSPTGHALAYVAGGEIWTVPATGGAPVQVTKGVGKVGAPRWSPAGTQLAFITDRDGFDQVALVSLTPTSQPAGWPQPLVRLPLDCRDPQWSPDGSQIAFVGLEGYDDHPIFVADVASGQVQRISPATGLWQCPRWTPDGELLAISDAEGYANLWRLGRELRPLTHGVEEKGHVALSPAGDRVAYTVNRGGHVGVNLLDLRSGEEHEVVPAAGVVQALSWAPGGDRLAYVHETARRQPELFTVATSGGEPQRLTCSAPQGVEGAFGVEPEIVHYRSVDGLTIPALLYTPPQASAGQPLPAIVWPHGGPTAQHDAGWYPWLQYFVQKGYAVLAPNFRGSTGYGRAFELAGTGEWGGKDLADVVAGADYLRGLPGVNGRRIGIHGGSYGGYQTLLALAKSPETFCCGVGFFGVSNRFSSWRDTDRIGKRNMERKLGKPTDNPDLYREASPLTYVANVQVPLMLQHGEDDPRVPFGQSVEMVEALRRLGKPVEFHAYPGEGHGFVQPQHVEQVHTRMERFLELYL